MSDTTRVQVQDLAPGPRLQSAPVASDNFVQVAQPIMSRDAENFADALGFFNQNLSNMSAAMRLKRRQNDDVKEQIQENTLNLSTAEQKREIAATGMIGGETLVNARLKKMAGAADGAQWAASVKEHLATQNLAGMDVEAFVQQQAGEYMKGVNGDPFVTGGFARYVDDVTGWAKGQQTSQGLQEREKLATDTSFQFLKTRVDGWVKEGVTPEQLHANVRQFYSEIGAGNDRILPEETIDAHVMAIASQLVETNPEDAMALITQGRKGTDGTDLGTLAHDPAYSGQVANIVSRGKKVIQDRQTVEAFNGRRQENYGRILRDGNYTAFQDLTVNGKNLTAEEQKTQFIGDLTAEMDRRVAAGQATEATKRAEIRRYTSRMNIDDPTIKGEIDGLERRYSTVDVKTQPEQLKDLETRMALYKEAKENNRQFLYSQVGGKTQDFAEAFDLYKRYMGPSSEGALEFANQVVNPANGTPSGLAFKRDEIANKVTSKLSGWINNDSMTYDAAYAQQIEKVAGLYVQSGMNVNTAIDAATERVFEKTPNYGGDPLMGMEGQNLPEDYQEILSGMAEDYKVLDSRGKTFEGTPTFVHLDGGMMAMRDRESGTFLEDENGGLIVFNIQHLRNLSGERQKTKDAEAVKAVTEAQKTYSDGVTAGRTWGRNVDDDLSPAKPVTSGRSKPPTPPPSRGFRDFLGSMLGR